MPSPQHLADAVLVLHAAVVLFVVGGFAAVVLGRWRGWRWTEHRGFRVLHLATIVVIVAQAWLGQHCPLTLLESHLRAQAGVAAYEKSFIEHWLQRLIYFEAPFWVFTLAYTVFGVLAWWAWRLPPFRSSR